MPHITLNGLDFFYAWHGAENAFPLVLVNGLLADTTSWVFQVPALATRFRVLTYDCRGQGQSAKPPGPYAPPLHTQDLLALLDALAVEQAHVVGLSNGGAIALSLAASQPTRVARLVVADAVARVDVALGAKVRSWLAALDVGGLGLRFDVATPWVWGATFLNHNEANLAAWRAKALEADPQAIRTLLNGTPFDLMPLLGQIQAPTLVLVGEEDLLAPPWEARAIAAAIPQAQFQIVPQAGHALPFERPETFNSLVLQFLS